MKIHESGAWEGLDIRKEHHFDAPLCNEFIAFFKSEKGAKIVDLGCGMGEYVQAFNRAGLCAEGFDGNPHTPELTNNTCWIMDISTPVKFDKPYDWVMSLEVGEHLPKQFEDIFIKNLHENNTKGIILSWAVKGQGGVGHFNEQNNNYVKQKLTALGYTNDLVTEQRMRSVAALRWFRNTIMVFRKN